MFTLFRSLPSAEDKTKYLTLAGALGHSLAKSLMEKRPPNNSETRDRAERILQNIALSRQDGRVGTQNEGCSAANWSDIANTSTGSGGSTSNDRDIGGPGEHSESRGARSDSNGKGNDGYEFSFTHTDRSGDHWAAPDGSTMTWDSSNDRMVSYRDSAGDLTKCHAVSTDNGSTTYSCDDGWTVTY